MPIGYCCGCLSQLMEETAYLVKVISTLFLPIGKLCGVTAVTAGKPNDKFCLSLRKSIFKEQGSILCLPKNQYGILLKQGIVSACTYYNR